MKLLDLTSFSTTLSVLLSCSTVDSAPVEDSSVAKYNGQSHPERWVLYDLERPFGAFHPGNSTDIDIEKRTPVTVCERIIGGLAACYVFGNGAVAIGNAIGQRISDIRWQRSCGTFTGQYSGVGYRYQANGKNCDTTAEQATIQGALIHHLQTVDNGQICSMEYLDLTHGGTWDGYLLLGPADSFDGNQYCGPQLPRDSFGECSSGGNADVP